MAKRVAVTGAAGGISTVLRESWRSRYEELRLHDRVPVPDPQDGEVVFTSDLTDRETVRELLDGCDAVIHLGAISDEAPFEDILSANYQGTYEVFEAARELGVPRIVFASSNHTIGCYPRSEHIDNRAPVRPDTFYGVSKVFGETLGRLYHDKWGLEVVCVRIGSFQDQPHEPRHLSTWLGYDDARQLFERAVEAENVGFQIVWGASDNKRGFWDNEKPSAAIGYKPTQRSEDFADEIADMPDEGMGSEHQGGVFVDPDYRGGLGSQAQAANRP